jgi:hypothetical protein
MEHDQKKSTIHTHFHKIIKRGPPRTKNFNWETIPKPLCDLSAFGEPFSKEEVRPRWRIPQVIKAPEQDGYTGAFFKACWNTIKMDVMAVINKFSNLHTSNLHWLNYANIVTIPKTREPKRSPISAPLASFMPLQS